MFALGVVIETVAYFTKPEWFLAGEYTRLAWLAGVEARTVEIGDHRVAYYDGGEGTPVVLVHGFAGNKEYWLELARELDGHRLVIPDLQGWGRSTRRDDADYRVDAQVERFVAFLDALDLERVHLVGHSMGGHIAGLVAARHPERVTTLTLVETAGVRFTPNDFARRVFAGETPFNFGTRAEFDAFMHELFVAPRWLPPRIRGVLIEDSRSRHAFQARLLAEMGREDQAFTLEHELPSITPATLVVWCDGDRLLDVSSVATIRAKLPSAEAVVLTGCSHMPMMEKPVELAEALRKHLE